MEISFKIVAASRLPTVSADAAVMKKRMFLMATILIESDAALRKVEWGRAVNVILCGDCGDCDESMRIEERQTSGPFIYFKRTSE